MQSRSIRVAVSSIAKYTLSHRYLVPQKSSCYRSKSLVARFPIHHNVRQFSQTIPKMVMDSKSRIEALRAWMKEKQLDAYVVPSGDAHDSEYLAPCDERRAFITDFDGSAGTAIITHNEAMCWTDGRYWLQAEKQLGEGWTLMKAGLPEVPTWARWLKDELPPSSKIGIDPTVLPYAEFKKLHEMVTKKPTNSSLIPVSENIVDHLWSSARPPRPANQVFQLEDKFTGESVGSKLSLLRDKLKRIGSPGTIVTSLDEVAWLLNLRGTDIPYNPVFFAYIIVTRDDCTLFINPASLSENTRKYLHDNNVTILEYEQVWSSLQSLAKQVQSEQKTNGDSEQPAAKKAKVESEKKEDPAEKLEKSDKILVGEQTSWAVANTIGEDLVEARRSMIMDAKAKKNATEIEGFRQCNIRDGAALVRYFAWLEEELGKGNKWKEHDAAMQLEKFRSEGKNFQGLSFPTISSTGPNGAVIHYHPSETDSDVIDPNNLYLCDSGAQYSDGTTDTTRTLHFGTPSKDQIRAYTRVLQGVIAIDSAIFPKGTTGYLLDPLARKALWADGLDFRHGTGHGVGHFLNVHEGPQGIGQRVTYNDIPLQPGMVISNEPGYYADGKWGIRIENVVCVRQAETPNNFGNKGYYGMENFTMVPMQRKLVDIELMSQQERDWLSAFQAEVKEKVTPILKEYQDERALKWLEKECAAA